MCYSAQIKADYKAYVRLFGATVSMKEFFDIYWRRQHQEPSMKIPKALDFNVAEPETDDEREIRTLVDTWDTRQTTRIEQELFAQRKRLVDAERSLVSKHTKKALSDQRIAIRKIDAARTRLADLTRTEPLQRDARIFPGWYAPVMVMQDRKRVVKPMRYQCRPAGVPAFYDKKYPGTYNARTSSLGAFWRNLFGYSHALLVVNAFFENVKLPAREQPDPAQGEVEQNVVLEFRPRPEQDMYIACLWSHWIGTNGEPDLLSFAAITDEPPPEVAAAGHDRCIVQIKPEHVDAWLNPDPNDLDAQRAILADRALPYYEHRLAA